MTSLLSGFSVRAKLLSPVILFILILLIVVFLYLRNQSSINNAEQELSLSSELAEEVSSLTLAVDRYINSHNGFAAVIKQFADTQEKIRAVSDSAGSGMNTLLKSSGANAEKINGLFDRNSQLVSSMEAVVSASMGESNKFIYAMSDMLADESTRQNVSTFEGQVIRDALLHTNNNYKIWLMFSELSGNLEKADELINFINELDAASDRAIVLLEGTPMLENALAARRANGEIRDIAEQYIANSREIRTLQVQIEKDMRTLLDSLRNWNHEVNSMTIDAISSSILQIIMVLVFAVMVAIVLSLVFATSITTPLKELQKRINGLANAGGDLTYRLDMQRQDEIGDLANGINRFLGVLQDIFRSVASSGELISQRADAALERNKNTLQRVDTQQHETTKVATAFDQMESSIQGIASSTAVAADKVQEAEQSSKRVVSTIGVTISEIDKLSDNLKNATDVIIALNQDSQNIGGILDVIRGIAEQTNLLALNAAIEAARAGEQGRGFAVVADEVRSLAQRTQSSIEQINTMISKLQAASEQARSTIESGNEQIGLTVQHSQEAGESVEHIVQLVSEIAQMNLQIASAAEEQSSVAAEVNRIIAGINQLSIEGSRAASEASTAAAEQANSAKEMFTVIGKFKV
ncbi:methyl-accepting chemotaxis protein [Alteromonas lipolytica]|uniref:Chemotaxis protein n=1 Tax=Alteromonas lipolytica TaxID=1856405 RepID=A0A1E8FBP0_9ALTE|nr:methyl-accepting chemotaxis protein [Alteromonas lipolytica]OFI33342.1 hypothetical protein BFC17_03515 [Alteromonas lipolytica]GGF60566.1 methyl-accepting chemotaxis protein [Alteromonas lipolytica]